MKKGKAFIAGAQATLTTTELEIVFWSKPERQTTWSACRSRRLRRTWPRIGKGNSPQPLQLQDQLGKCFHLCSSQVWSLLFPWHGRSLPPIQLYSWSGLISLDQRQQQKMSVFKKHASPSLPNLWEDKWQPSFKACDSVLPFQILYDQGVITGFVWQVVLKEQFLSQNLVTLFSTISWHLPQSMIWKNMNKNWNFFATPCNSACFQFVGIPWKGWIGIKSFWSTVTCCLAHWHMGHLHFFRIFREYFPQHLATLPGDKWEHPDAMAVAAIVDRLDMQFQIMQ